MPTLAEKYEYFKQLQAKPKPYSLSETLRKENEETNTVEYGEEDEGLGNVLDIEDDDDEEYEA